MTPPSTRGTIGSIALVVIGFVVAGVLVVQTERREPADDTSGTEAALPEGCVGDVQVVAPVASGERTRLTDLPAGRRLDASGARWHGRQDWPVHIEGAAGLCWSGGDIRGVFDLGTSWEALHGTGALNIDAPRAWVGGVRIHNYGDGIRLLDEARDTTILDVHLSFIRDDCIENDDLHGTVVRDSLLDGCYVAFSARPWQDDFEGTGSDQRWVIEDSLVRLQPMPTVYRGPMPGHGGFFKWDGAGRSPRLVLRGNVFRADQDSNHTTMGVPPGALVACEGNTMVWLGEGPYPAELPDCFTVTTDETVWDDAVARWRAEHR